MSTDDNKDHEKKLVQFALDQTKKYLQEKNDGKAFANFLVVFKFASKEHESLRSEFLECTGRWTKALRRMGRVQDMLTCLHEACQVLPHQPELLNSLGSELFSLGFLDEAASYFRRALRVDPYFLLALHNLQNLSGHVVERWHFRMLNDQRRNQAYRDAIQRAISAGFTDVLDLGSGTGLLSMYAAEAGATNIYGCEMSKTMYNISCDCLAANKMSDKVKLIHKKSTDLSIPEDLQSRVSLLVTETFDAGLLGEHVLTSLSHAWQHLLSSTENKKARVIPSRASVYICALECETIRKQNRSIYPGVRHLSFGPCRFVSGIGSGAESNMSSEPYTSHLLSDVPGGYKLLSQKLLLSKFNFQDPQDVERYIAACSRDLELTVSSRGQLDALVMWFDLDLDDHVTLSSSPETDSCWEQALYPIHPGYKDDMQSTLVGPGDRLCVNLSLHSNAIWLECVEIKRLDVTKSSTDTCMELDIDQSDLDFDTCHLTDFPSRQFTLSPDDISRLNDLTWNRSYCQAMEEIRGQTSDTSSTSRFSVLVFASGFTTLPLQALKVGAAEVCVVTSDETSMIEALAEENGLELARVHVEKQLEDVTGQWSAIVVLDLVEPSGCLGQRILEDVVLARMTCLPPNGVVIPGQVSVYGLLIESNSLLKDSMVTSDDNTLGISVKEFINDFQMTHHVDVCLSTLKHKKLSEPFQLFTVDLNQPLRVDEGVEASFLHQDCSFVIKATECGTVCGLVFWFDLKLSPSVSYSTLSASGHTRQGAVVQRDSFQVGMGSEVAVHAICKNSCFDVLLSLL